MRIIPSLIIAVVVLSGCSGNMDQTGGQPVSDRSVQPSSEAPVTYPKLKSYSVVKDGVAYTFSRTDSIPPDLSLRSSAKPVTPADRLPDLAVMLMDVLATVKQEATMSTSFGQKDASGSMVIDIDPAPPVYDYYVSIHEGNQMVRSYQFAFDGLAEGICTELVLNESLTKYTMSAASTQATKAFFETYLEK